MTLFASRSNRDPNPWVCREHGGICAFPDRGAMGVREYAPRSNFEYSTVNPVNPILAAYRVDRMTPMDLPEARWDWFYLDTLELWRAKVGDEAVLHAGRVLDRLSRMRSRHG